VLAKVPVKRLDGKSSFAVLTQYIASQAAALKASEQIWEIDHAAHEMEHVASLNERVKDAVYHYVLSWRDGESPTDGQAFDAVAATLTALQMRDHQWVAAVHRNTEHVHAHVAVNRVNPETLKSVYPKGDWLALDRACRELELRHGWSHDHGPHGVLIGPDDVPTVTRQQRDAGEGSRVGPSTGARDFAAWSGRESFHDWVGKGPGAELKRLLDTPNVKWQHVHELLAGFNLEYQAKGSGAVVVDRHDPDKLHAKASHIGRFASLGKLQERLGSFESASQQPTQQRTVGQEPAKGKSYAQDVAAVAMGSDGRHVESDRLYARYAAVKEEWEQTEGRKRESAWRQQRATEKDRFDSLRQENRAARERLTESRRKTSKRALFSLQAFVTATKREELKLEIRQERKEVRERFEYSRPGRWPNWLAQQAMAGDNAAVAALRRRRYRQQNRSLEAPVTEVGIVAGAAEPRTAVLPGIRWTINQRGVNYTMNNTAVFRDEGRRVVFNDLNDDAIRAGLMLCREKWADGLSITGIDQFKARAHALAAEMGIRVASQERSGPLKARQAEPACTRCIGTQLSQADLDLERLSATHGKPVTESKTAVGRRHTGRVVAAGQNANGDGLVVLDIGRELTVLHTDRSVAAETHRKVGSWIQAGAIADERVPGGYGWRFTDGVRCHGVGLDYGG